MGHGTNVNKDSLFAHDCILFYLCFAQGLVWNLERVVELQSANMQLGHGPGLLLALEVKIGHLA